jgi:predicted dehydrogenase
MSRTYNWAIIGCGRIAEKFAADLALLPNARLYAAASRSLDKAQAFATKLGFDKAFGSYEAMVADPDVDIVYVATPHAFHREHTVLSLDHHKAVLCEKAFAINAHEAQAMIACARRNDTFLMEAFWTRFQPSYQYAMQIVESAALGPLKLVRSDFAFRANADPAKRLYNVDLGGGSLLDIGIYPVFMALTALGKPDRIQTMAAFSPTGSEESIVMSFEYPQGRMASLISSFASSSPTEAEYWFERGYVRLNRKFNTPTSVTIQEDGKPEATVTFAQGAGSGYELEAAHVMACLDAGRKESPLLPLSFSLQMMDLLDRIRHSAGIVYPRSD